MLKRILTALWGIPLILWIVHVGDQLFFIFVVLVACLGLYEFYSLLEKNNYKTLKTEGIVTGFLYLTFLYLESRWALRIFLPLLIVSILIYELLKKEHSVIEISLTFLGFFYIPFLSGYFLLLRNLPQGEILTYYTFLVTWASDSAAYFIGKFFGKHKLAPSISPNKTIEGTVAGIIGSIIVSLAFGAIYYEKYLLPIILGISLGIMGQLGDLVESMLKREIGVKDSSSLLPGHGGILDRFDSLFFIVPTTYYMLFILRLL
jgi:phosphatidate cytidylyltransferase